MKFTRINSNTVNCIITADDMDEQGISIEDILGQSKEAMSFFQDIISRASEEVDYKPEGNVMPIQMAVLPDKSISLTLSENPQAAVADMLKGLADKLQQFLTDIQNKGIIKASDEKIEAESENFKLDIHIGANGEKASDTDVKDRESETDRLLPILKFTDYVFSFDDLRTVIRFAKTLGEMKLLPSALYKSVSDGRFYLYMIPGADRAEFATAFVHAGEYGRFVSVEKRYVLHMQETMECIIAHGALNKLRSL